MRPKKIGGGKKVRLSDGREFDSLSAAGRAIGVTASAVRQARQNNRAVRGLMVESA
jgi:3-deoxy-D-arabino-heptulosonate 7-phosphate (DAHP) synthase